METSLHRQLKHHFAADVDSIEVAVDRYRIDAIDPQGNLVEIQHSALGSIRKKASKLLADGYGLRIIKPSIVCKWIETFDREGGELLRRRRSPKKLMPIDIFRELIHFTNVFPHPHLTLEILAVDCIEQRIDRPNKRWKRKQYQVIDQHLAKVHQSIKLQSVDDLWPLLGNPRLPKPFDTQQLAEMTGQPRWFAQQIAYTLQRCFATKSVGKRGNSILYQVLTSRQRKSLQQPSSADAA
jgi:hypothetical protein